VQTYNNSNPFNFRLDIYLKFHKYLYIYCDGYGHLLRNGSQIYITLLRRIVAIPRQRLGKQLLSLERMLKKVIPWQQLEQQVKTYPSTRCLLFGAPIPYSGRWAFQIREDQRTRSETQRQSRGTRADQWRKVRSDQQRRTKKEHGSEEAVSLVRVTL
jgi:hypothetical protein